MRVLFTIITLAFCFVCRSQELHYIEEDETVFFLPELLSGIGIDRNLNISNDLQLHLFMSVGKHNYSRTHEWANRLNYPRVGISLGYSNFGNSQFGEAVSLFPFIEFDITDRFSLMSGIGFAYLNTIYDPISNPENTGISSHYNGTFRMSGTYLIVKGKHIDWRLGLAFLHYSNGRTKIPNDGLNSILLGVSAQVNSKNELMVIEKPEFDRSVQSYFLLRFGLGLNAISETFNNAKPVYTFAPSYGKIINRTFKLGIGFYYRFYQHYYDYIRDEEELVVTDYPEFTNSPTLYASAFGVFGSFELLLGHVGIEIAGGINIFKPFYAIDYRLNQGEVIENSEGNLQPIYADLDFEYELKRSISGRLGLKYYLHSNNDFPKNNWFIGGHINSNLGQADFMEFSLGYIHRLSLKQSTNY